MSMFLDIDWTTRTRQAKTMSLNVDMEISRSSKSSGLVVNCSIVGMFLNVETSAFRNTQPHLLMKRKIQQLFQVTVRRHIDERHMQLQKVHSDDKNPIPSETPSYLEQIF